MNTKHKKTLAREFIVTIIFLLLGVSLYYSTFPYNYYLENKKSKKATEINELTSLRDSLASIFEEKKIAQEWFYKQVTTEYEVYNVNRIDTLWNSFLKISENDSIEIKWKGKWKADDITLFFEKIGFSRPDSLNNFIKRYSYSKSETSAKQRVENINNDIKILKKDFHSISILSPHNQIHFLKKSLIVLFIILFVLRYIYYGIKWSLKTLRE